MALGTLLGLAAGTWAAFTLPQRIAPFPDGAKRFLQPGVAPGLQGGPPLGILGSEGCAPGLVSVHTEGALRGQVCVTADQRERFLRETERARMLQIAAFIGLIAGGYVVGKALEEA